MKTFLKIFGIIAVVAVIGVSMAGCIINFGEDTIEITVYNRSAVSVTVSIFKDTLISNAGDEKTIPAGASDKLSIKKSVGHVVQADFATGSTGKCYYPSNQQLHFADSNYALYFNGTTLSTSAPPTTGTIVFKNDDSTATETSGGSTVKNVYVLSGSTSSGSVVASSLSQSIKYNDERTFSNLPAGQYYVYAEDYLNNKYGGEVTVTAGETITLLWTDQEQFPDTIRD